jgi:predicted small secreted protein
MRQLILLALPFVLAACSNDTATGAGSVSAGEAKALDDAAEMIEARRLPEEALRPPAAQPTAPSAAK